MRIEHGQPAYEAPTPLPPGGMPAPPLHRVREPDVIVDIGVPASPPADVLERIHMAAEHALATAADDRELHFRKDPASSRVIVEVRDLRGTVIRTIPPSAALEAMTPGIWH